MSLWRELDGGGEKEGDERRNKKKEKMEGKKWGKWKRKETKKYRKNGNNTPSLSLSL